VKLTTLKPRLSTIVTQRVPTQEVERLRGRRAVERRKRWLREHPLCVECEKADRVTAATVPDHIVALVNGGPDTEDNLQSLCEECHRKKTARDLGHKVKPAIGLDGWPTEG
jgi:5-methylcytosine-specific restriction enzyme A